MKILLVVHQFLPDFFAGTEILTYGLAKAFKSFGIDVSVLTGFPYESKKQNTEFVDQYNYNGIDVVRYCIKRKRLRQFNDNVKDEYNNKNTRKVFEAILENIDPDIIHFMHFSRISTSAIDVCQSLNIPIVFTATDFWFICPMSQLLLKDGSLCEGPDPHAINCFKHFSSLLFRWQISKTINLVPDPVFGKAMHIMKSSLIKNLWPCSMINSLKNRKGFLFKQINKIDRILVPTKLMKRILVGNGLNSDKCVFSQYGIELPEYKGTSNNHDKFKIGFIGTLSKYKGAHVLLNAVNEIPIEKYNYEVIIYGNTHQFPSYMDELKQISRNNGSITFMGTFPNDKIYEVISELDVLVVPSLWYENTPLVIYHAHAVKCPVIASNLEGMTEAVRNNIDGFVFEKGNHIQLAECLTILMDNNGILNDFKRNIKLPKCNKAYAKEMIDIYKELVAG
jgi:glycosyltransferase involved in cell wall biosynthesis